MLLAQLAAIAAGAFLVAAGLRTALRPDRRALHLALGISGMVVGAAVLAIVLLWLAGSTALTPLRPPATGFPTVPVRR